MTTCLRGYTGEPASRGTPAYLGNNNFVLCDLCLRLDLYIQQTQADMTRIRLTCADGKALHYRSYPRQRPRYNGAPTAVCSNCRESFLCADGYYVCEDADTTCDFDLCWTCVWKENRMRCKYCKEENELFFTTKKRERYGNSTFYCTLCKTDIVNYAEGYFVCKQAESSCDFDCCKNCYNAGPSQG